MRYPIIIVCSVCLAVFALGSVQPALHQETTDAVGPRPLEKSTETAVVRDYVQAWQSLSVALEQNRADLLDQNFVGAAKERLAGTIREQAALGIQTRYRDSAHDVRLAFYSPEGLSIQLVDTVDYDVQIVDHERLLTLQHVRARYIAVLTPTEERWKVRFFQAAPE